MKVDLVESRVSVVACGHVRVAVPPGMSKLELAVVLQGMASAILEEALSGEHDQPQGGNGNGNGNGANRVAQAEAADKRGMPRRKVLRRRKVRGGTAEKLECGHTVRLTSSQKPHARRSCPECAQTVEAEVEA